MTIKKTKKKKKSRKFYLKKLSSSITDDWFSKKEWGISSNLVRLAWTLTIKFHVGCGLRKLYKQERLRMQWC